jgi:uncharacterized protein
MRISSPRLRRLDNALADLPADSEAMLLSELDGYLVGVIVCPEAIDADEWLPPVWGEEGDDPLFEDEREAEWYAALIVEHHAAILRALGKGQGHYAPFLEIDTPRGEVLWELWIEGFDAAVQLRSDSWAALAESDLPDVAEAFAGLMTLVQIARDESSLERDVIDALTEDAPRLIPIWVTTLYAAVRARYAAPTAADIVPTAKVGRNDPCPCGSGRKYKKCCGAN